AQQQSEKQAAEELAKARQIEEAIHWRQRFEAAVVSSLVGAGAEWLAAFRVPDYQCAKLPEFTGVSQWYFALFDASAFGLWPISLQMQAGSGTVREWRPTATARWRVCRPTGDITFTKFEEALRWAAEFVSTPF
ncbi:MAG TPA: hypothetical protein VGE74_22660, partial [Gemmata sp.]